MFVTYEREKLINAFIYFVRNTKRCHKLKLFKLLSFLDFEHYRQTGRSVTGLRYDAWPMGPVPSELDEEFKSPPSDLAAAMSIRKVSSGETRERTIDDRAEYEIQRERSAAYPSSEYAPSRAIEWFEFKPKKRFDPKYFTKRELHIMEVLAEIFRDALGNDMKAVSHMKGLPWRQVYGHGEGNGRPIPYELSLTSDPFIKDIPTIDLEELAYRREALREVKSYEEM